MGKLNQIYITNQASGSSKVGKLKELKISPSDSLSQSDSFNNYFNSYTC